MRILLIAFFSTCLSLGCDFDCTEAEVFINFPDGSELDADGMDSKLLELVIENNYLKNNYVKIRTSNGSLLPISSTNQTPGLNELLVKAQSGRVSCFLVSSSLIDDEVIISAVIDDCEFFETANFQRVYPDAFELSANTVNPAVEDEVFLTVELTKANNGFISSNADVNFSIEVEKDDSSTLQVDIAATIQANEVDGVQTAIAKLENLSPGAGTVTVTASTETASETLISESIQITY